MYKRYTYNRALRFMGPMTPMVKRIVVVTVAIYILQILLSFQGIPLVLYLGLVPQTVTHDYRIYQLITYMFLHGGPMHLLLNMFVVWMFGGEIEYTLGSKRFLFYYLLTGVGSGIMTSIFLYNSSIPVVGASGAIYGLLLAYGLFFPNRMVLLMFLFPIKVKYMVVIFAFIEFMSTISYSQDGISHITHLGGMLVGLIYLLWFRGSLTSHKMKKRFRQFIHSEDHDDDRRTLH